MQVTRALAFSRTVRPWRRRRIINCSSIVGIVSLVGGCGWQEVVRLVVRDCEGAV